jgi:hypothetical protein
MDAKQFFFERYEGFQEYPEQLVAGLSETQVRQSPHPRVNPIAWALWHLARCEDVCVNRVLTDGVQVLDEGDRVARLRVSNRGTGTGMTRAKVSALAEEIDLAELDTYRAAVTSRTRATVRSIPSAELASTLSPARLRQVFMDEGAGGDVAAKIVEAYTGQTKGWLLGHLVLTHHYYHVGQAFAVRVMHGAANPW